MTERPAPRVAQVVFDTRAAREAAEFWRQLLDLTYRDGHEPPAPGEDDGAGRNWLNLRGSPTAPNLAFQQVDDLPAATWPHAGVPQQLHLDLLVHDVAELDAVHARVLELGGTLRPDRSADPIEALRVFADPDGHPFCVIVAPRG